VSNPKDNARDDGPLYIAGICIALSAGFSLGMSVANIATRESEGPMVRAGQSGVAHASASEAPASPYSAPAADAQSTGPDIHDLYAAIAYVESGGERDRDNATGDGGASLGRYQIQLAYWRDAWGLDRAAVTDAMREQYRVDVTNPEMARETMLRYWRRYCPAALDSGDWETLARVHNGGPRGAEKDATADYVARVLRAMER